MNVHWTYRCRRAPLTAAAAILGVVAALSPVISSASGTLYTGAGVGPTVEVAVQSAIWDAEAAASANQLYTCQLVGEPSIYPGPSLAWGRNYTAEVTLSCTP